MHNELLTKCWLLSTANRNHIEIGAGLLKPVMDNTISTGHGWNVELATLVIQGTRLHTSENTITTG